MSTSAESVKNEKPRRVKGRRSEPAEKATDREREGRASASREASLPARERSWGEKHGGTIVIGLVFTLVALLVLVRTSCS